MRIAKGILPLALLAGLSMNALAERELPSKVFDCQVATISGAYGLVMIQANSLEQARTESVGRTASTMAGAKGTANRVIQCIEKRKGSSFSDSGFQAWFDSLEEG
ncbi:MAG: hypothetical protein AAF699_11415 [Pseudomonadota bacterium]